MQDEITNTFVTDFFPHVIYLRDITVKAVEPT